MSCGSANELHVNINQETTCTYKPTMEGDIEMFLRQRPVRATTCRKLKKTQKAERQRPSIFALCDHYTHKKKTQKRQPFGLFACALYSHHTETVESLC